MTRSLLKTGLSLVIGYGALTGAAYALQRKLLFPAPQPPRAPSPSQGKLIKTTSSSGNEVFVLWSFTTQDRPTIVHFHGNGEQLADIGNLAQWFYSEKINMLAVEYPGYGLASEQSPSEEELYLSAEEALRYLREQLLIPVEQTILMGQSLGTGVATEMARRGHGARLILLSPYTSIPDVAAHVIPVFPVRKLLKDRFATAEKASQITIPVKIIHGEKDALIPAQMGKTLGTLFPHAVVEIVTGAHHNDLFSPPHGPSLLAGLATFVNSTDYKKLFYLPNSAIFFNCS